MSTQENELKNKLDISEEKSPLRFVTAASLFDGHDAAINIMRRIIQATGCEVIHLGHDRSVEEVVNCAIQEDANAIAPPDPPSPITIAIVGTFKFIQHSIDFAIASA